MCWYYHKRKKSRRKNKEYLLGENMMSLKELSICIIVLNVFELKDIIKYIIYIYIYKRQCRERIL